MAYTLLKMVQLILSSMDSDEVDSITDTTEAQQVVDVIETTFNDLATTVKFPEHKDFFQLELLDFQPTLMIIPDNVISFDWLQYDISDATTRNMVELLPLGRYEFFNRMQGLNTDNADVYSTTYTNLDTQAFDIRGYNDRHPSFYTNIGDRVLAFDNYDQVQSATLQPTRTQGYGRIIQVFSRDDAFVPQIDEQSFTLLFNEAKAQAFIELKQVQNAKADQRARRALVQTQNNKTRVPAESFRIDKTPDFGRKGPGRSRVRFE